MKEERKIVGRKKKPASEKFDQVIHFKLTSTDKDDLVIRTKSFGTDLSTYIRAQVFRKDLNYLTKDYKTLFTEVNRIGVNLNQMVKALNVGGMTVSNTEIAKQLQEINNKLSMILDAK